MKDVLLGVFVAVFLFIGTAYADRTTTYRDQYGNYVGSKTTWGDTSTYRNRYGDNAGTAQRNQDGSTDYRNKYGDYVGGEEAEDDR